MNVDFTSGETNAVINWIETDERRYRYWREMAHHAVTSFGQIAALSRVSEALYDAVARTLPESDGLVGDLLPRVLVRVNFYEIAAALIRDAEETSVDAAA